MPHDTIHQIVKFSETKNLGSLFYKLPEAYRDQSMMARDIARVFASELKRSQGPQKKRCFTKIYYKKGSRRDCKTARCRKNLARTEKNISKSCAC